MYLLLIVLVVIVIILWLNCDNKETFGSGWYYPNMTRQNSYWDVREYDPIDDGSVFPMRSRTDINESDKAIDANYYDFRAPSYMS